MPETQSGLDGQIAVVTGAANGIGLHLVGHLRALGMRIAAVDTDIAALKHLEAKACDDALVGFAADIRDEATAKQIFDAVETRWGTPQALVNNAGIVRQGMLLETTPAMWREVIDVNLTGTFIYTVEAAKRMRARKYGRIVNVTSHAGLLGTVTRGAYSAAKAGMIALTRTAAVELAKDGITSNGVAPGAIETPRVTATHKPARRAAWNAAIPQGRYGGMDELAAVIAFLISPAASYVNGQTLSVDGGFSIAGLLSTT
jgi:NAD(P)-dependent dehydrogenase (short-subunit alcohol dehydrogenase family)